MKYNWQQSDWPHFHYNLTAFQPDLYRYAEATGRLSGSFPSSSIGTAGTSTPQN